MLLGSNMLEIAMGLIFVYWLFSLICSTLVELIAGARQWRSTTLQATLKTLLGGLSPSFLAHPLITLGGSGEGKRPSYISGTTFAHTLLAVVAAEADEARPLKTVEELRGLVDKIEEPTVKKALLGLVEEADSDLAVVRHRIACWFDGAMDRVSGSYRRRAQRWTLGIAFSVALLANVDTLAIARTLRVDPALRAQVTLAAEEVIRREQSAPGAPADSDKTLKEALVTLNRLDLPVGWTEERVKEIKSAGDGLIKLVGILLTAFALTLGAPFWFDLLNKVVNARSTGKKPDPTPPAPPAPTAAPAPSH